MLKVELRCGCGGRVECRGSVRMYETGRATVSMEDGHREWLAGDWKAPIETVEMDDPPFHCLECDRQQELSDLVPMVPVRA